MKERKTDINHLDFSNLMELRDNLIQPPVSYVYDNSCIVIPDNARLGVASTPLNLSNPTRVNIFLFALCLDGDCVIECDLQHCHITSGTLFLCKPGSVLRVESGQTSSLSVLMGDESFFQSLSVNIQKLLPHYEALQKLSHIQLTPAECDRLKSLLRFLATAISGDRRQLYYHDLVRSYVMSFSYEVISLLSRGLEVQPVQSVPFSHTQVYANRFIELVRQNFRTERKVAAYARMLNITPKYLGSLVALQTGSTATQWISGLVIAEAKNLLLNTAMSIQQISLELHFPNQSFFGKYFKAHMGVSPGEFRYQCMR